MRWGSVEVPLRSAWKQPQQLMRLLDFHCFSNGKCVEDPLRSVGSNLNSLWDCSISIVFPIENALRVRWGRLENNLMMFRWGLLESNLDSLWERLIFIVFPIENALRTDILQFRWGAICTKRFQKQGPRPFGPLQTEPLSAFLDSWKQRCFSCGFNLHVLLISLRSNVSCTAIPFDSSRY